MAPKRDFALDFVFDEKTRSCVADFTFAVEDSVDCAFDGTVDIGIGENNVGRFSAQLQCDPLQSVRRAAHDFFADGS